MDTLTLPPLGQITEENSASVVSYLALLAQEAGDARASWLPLADENVEIYTYGVKKSEYDDDKITVNEIQNAIIAATDLQTKEPLSPSLDASETGRPAEVFFSGPPQYAAMLGIPPQMIGQPLDEMFGERLKTLADTQQIPAEWVVTLDDKLVVDDYQNIFDVYWTRSDTDRWVRQNLLATNVQGWAWGLYEFHDDRQRHSIKNISIRQVYIDPTIEDIADAAYAMVDLVMDAEEAKSLFPSIADKIEAGSDRGMPKRPDAAYTFSPAFERNFNRPMVTMRVCWMRNQPVPLPAADAVDSGIVQLTDVPDATQEPAPEPMPAMLPQQGDVGPEMPSDEQPPEQPAEAPAPAAPATRPAYIHGDTGEEITPEHPAWPTRRVLRQIIVINSAFADDRECEHCDIPLLHNVNIPLIGQPFGIGEPFRLKGLQRSRSRVMNAITDHAEYFRAPVMAMSQSTYDALPDEVKDTGIQPNMLLVLPDDQWMSSGGKVFSVIDPPQTPPALVEISQLLHNELNELSGHTNEIRGITSNSQQSGKAIELLQGAATGQIGFKAQRTADMVRRMAQLMLYSLVNRLDAHAISRILRKYPPYIISRIMERAQEIEWEEKVTDTAGSGALIAAKKQEAIQLFQIRDPLTNEPVLSMESTREALSVDHQQEKERFKSEMLDGQQPGMQPQGPDDQQGDGQGKPGGGKPGEKKPAGKKPAGNNPA